MNFIGVSDLKKSREMWKLLAREKELVLNRDGKPGALIIEISPEGLESAVAAVRRALFSEAVSAVRRRAAKNPPAPGDIEREIHAARRGK